MQKWNHVSLSLYSLSFHLPYTSPSFSYFLYYIHTELIYSFNSLQGPILKEYILIFNYVILSFSLFPCLSPISYITMYTIF